MSRLMRFLNNLCLLLLLGATAAWAGYTADIDALVKKAEPRTPAPVLPAAAPVTRDLYRKTGESLFAASLKNTADYYIKQTPPYNNAGFHVDNALWLARMYRVSGNDTYADQAVKCLVQLQKLLANPPEDKSHLGLGWHQTIDLWHIEQYLKGHAAYTPQTAQLVRQLAQYALPAFPEGREEYGAFNRSFHLAVSAEALLALNPNVPDAAKFRKYCETIWSYWWQFRDQDESTDHYTALWFRYLLTWIELRKCENEFWADAGVKKMMERYLYYVTPMGAFPHVSDSTGWNVTWGHWVYIFEACATHYKDGRYKWAAHRLYEYGSTRIEKLGSWAYTGEEACWSLLNAYDAADETIAEKPREKAVAMLMRHASTMVTMDEVRKGRQFLFLSQEMGPDKLLFYGGSHKDAMSLMVDIVGDAGHSHARRPALLALTDQQSVLLMGLGYMDRNPEDHDMAQLSDYDGYPYDNTPYHIKSTNNLVQGATATDCGPVGYGMARVGNYMGYPATCDREVIFIKNVGVLVKDTVTLTLDLKLRWGQLYRVRNLGPDYGANWANTYLGEWVPLRGLGKNAGVLTRWRNTPRDLLLYYLPSPRGTLEVVDERAEDKTSPLPLRVQYTLRQTTAPNAPIHTATLLLPHAPGPGKPLADGVKVLANTADVTALEFTDETGDRHLLALNRKGGTLTIPGVLVTNGYLAYARKKGNDVVAAALYNGDKLTAWGKDAAKLAPKAKTETVP
jgi:hypothetical protein